ncbi:MAG: TerB family tellurite resistance protein [Candidatus Marinimicrobia bacterium]|nr:TerB family tellurite resistance protein [Candidatus Neomarinimicrobiota bacterium]
MAVGKKLFWGGLGWALAGPIGGIIGYAIAGMSDNQSSYTYTQAGKAHTQPGDFIVSILVLLAKVMKADGKLLKSELDYVRKFLSGQFPNHQVQQFMTLFKDILDKDYPLKDVCRQIQRQMDHPSRLELIHILFGLSAADGHVDETEIRVIHTMAGYLNVNQNDFESIKAMFIPNTSAAFTILETDPKATNDEIKKAYRKMANKYHPDKVTHLGEDFQKLAEDKFKAVNDAYHSIKKERGIR